MCAIFVVFVFNFRNVMMLFLIIEFDALAALYVYTYLLILEWWRISLYF